MLITIYSDGGLYEKAIQDQLKAVELDPENSGYWHSLAETYFFMVIKSAKRKHLSDL